MTATFSEAMLGNTITADSFTLRPATGGAKVPARTQPGNAQHTPVEEAPGRYVREKAS